jgi:glycosyltransferase involved in cell wall biosynthesis
MHVVHVITGLGGGGAEGTLYRLVENDAGNRHTVISLIDGGKYGPLLEKSGHAVYSLGMVRGRPSLGATFRLFRLLRALAPDVVQTWMYHADLLGGLAARFAGIKRVSWGIRHLNLDPEGSSHSTIRVAEACAFLSRWVPVQIICCSERAARVHGELGYVSEKFKIIPNGYDLVEFAHSSTLREATREELGIEQQETLIGMVARFNPQKDHETLLAALAHVVTAGIDFRCILAGAGMDGSNQLIAHQSSMLGLVDRIILLGPRGDVPALMNAMDINVLSSFAEAFPNVLAEAMACGTPCVTTDVGDAAVIVADTGWVVQPKQARELAEAIIAAIREREDTDSWKKRQVACRKRVEKEFGIDAMVAAYNQHWRDLFADK